jgi:serine/threonine protein kinase
LEKILANRAIPISLADIKQHLWSLLKAISACHERWILHRDLKPDNMLFLKDGTMKLADFGLARMYGTPKTRLSPQAITLWYGDILTSCASVKEQTNLLKPFAFSLSHAPIWTGTSLPSCCWAHSNILLQLICGV